MKAPSPSAIPWSLRREIQWTRHDSKSQAWVARDPLCRKLYRFGDEERTILGWLDGRSSLPELETRFAEQYGPKFIERPALLQLIQTAIHRGLLVHRGKMGTVPFGKAAPRLMEKLSSLPWRLLFSRVSLVNPHRQLQRIAGSFDCFFSRPAIAFWLSFGLLVWLLLLSRWSEIVALWPSWQELIHPATWLGMGTAFLLTRTIHELSHGLVCTRLGARCTDVGLLLMMGVACPYVDVTDSWRLGNRWHRIAIALAGIYAELIMASVAGLVWVATLDGPLHQFAFQILLICSVSTMVFNANPLMRYDGYFALCDLIDLPNLRDRADQTLKAWGKAFFLGKARTDPCSLIDCSLAGYGMLAIAYRLLFLLGLMSGIQYSCQYWEVPWLGWGVNSLVLFSSIVVPVLRAIQYTFAQWKAGLIRPLRAFLSWTLFWLLLILAAWLPIPSRIGAEAVLVPKNRSAVYASASGLVDPNGESNSGNADDQMNWVEKGSTLIQLVDASATDQWLKSEMRFTELTQELLLANRMSFQSREHLDRIPSLEAAVELARRQLQARSRYLERLSIPSPCDGVWQPVAVDLATSTIGQLPRRKWIGQDGVTIGGRWVEAGDLLGWVQDSEGWVLKLELDESQVEKIQVGARARICIDQRPGQIYLGRVLTIGKQTSDRMVELSPHAVLDQVQTGGSSNSTDDRNGLRAQYQVQVEMDSNSIEDPLHWDGRGQVVIEGTYQSLISRAGNWVKRNFRWTAG